MECTATILANAFIGVASLLGGYFGNEYGGPELIFAGGCFGAAIGYVLGWPLAEYLEPIVTWLLDDHAAWVMVPLVVLLAGVLLSISSIEEPCETAVQPDTEMSGACTVPADSAEPASQSRHPS